MHSPRAQCDKKLYQFTMKRLVETGQSHIAEETVESLVIENGRIAA